MKAVAPRAEPETDFLKLSSIRPLGARPDVAYVIEASSDLATWTALAVTPTVTPVDENHELVEVTDSVALTSASRRFLRLRVELAD